MTGIRVVMEDGLAKLVLDRGLANARDLGSVMAAIAGEVDDRVQESFEQKRDPVDGSAWPELRPATVRDRERKGFNGTDILQRTRILRAGIITDSDQNSVETATSVEYALFHHLGAPGANIPQRRFAGISEEDSHDFERMLAAHIAGP